MEFNVTKNVNDALSLPQIADLYLKVGITLEIFKWKYEQEFEHMKRMTIGVARTLCPKLESTSAVVPNEAQKLVLAQTFGLMAISAIAQISDAKASVSTENVIPLLCMANQTSRMSVDFIGGGVPQFVATPAQGKKEDQIVVKIVSGVPAYGNKVCAAMLTLGMKTCLVSMPIAVNAASIVAVAHKFSLDKSCAGHPFVPPKVHVPGVKDGRLTTAFSNVVMKRFTHTPSSVYQLIADTAKNSNKLVNWLSTYPPGSLGIPKGQVMAVPRLNGRDFKDLGIPNLKSYYELNFNQLGKAKDYLKNTDIGYPGLNAPLKWRLPVEVVTGSPDAEGFKRTLRCVYYGAGGNRARAMLERRLIVDAYDLKVSPAPTKKVSQADMERLKIFTWRVKDIFTHQTTDHEMFISDVYIPNWKVVGSEDPNGHLFVSGVIRGVIQNGSLVTCAKLPPVRLVKGFLPSAEEIDIYKSSYPFYACRVCRPLTTEVIYLRVDDVGDHRNRADLERKVAIMEQNLKLSPGDRFKLITDRESYERFVVKCYVCCCEEINFQQRRMASDPRDLYASTHNRPWGLASQDLPCLYIPKGMRGVGVNAIDKESNLFGMAVMGEEFSTDDFSDLMEQSDPHGEARADDVQVKLSSQIIDFSEDNQFDFNAPADEYVPAVRENQ